jgi:acetylglutamate kinase
VKIGGNVIDDEQSLKAFLRDFHNLEGLKMLVHGGGKLASELAAKLDIPVQMHEGRRITDGEMLKVVTMVYAGYINKNVVAMLQGFGTNAIGLSGADGNCIKAVKRQHPSIDFGLVGDITSEDVNKDFFSDMLHRHITPVVCAITHDYAGQLLNTNADTIASVLAVALSRRFKTQLKFSFEKKGVLMDVNDEHTVIHEINKKNYTKLKGEGIINEGMIPKLDNAFDAINKGVETVYIGETKIID